MSLIAFDTIPANVLQNIQLIATDMDGTLTRGGKFTPALLQSLADLQRVGVPVLIVTGRSAGWVEGVVSYLPVAGAIAENGGLFYSTSPQGNPLNLWMDNLDITAHRQQLAEMFAILKAEFPRIEEASDNRFRLTDWTFDIGDLSRSELETLSDRCHAQNWGFTYSTVQCHIKPLHQEKATTLLHVLKQHFPHLAPAQVLTIGDSPNDESLFRSDRFPHSVGVANVQHYLNQLTHKPAYITSEAEVLGFCQVARSLTALAPLR